MNKPLRPRRVKVCDDDPRDELRRSFSIHLQQENAGLKAALTAKEKECAAQRAIILAAEPYVGMATLYPHAQRLNAAALHGTMLRAIGNDATIPVSQPARKGTIRKAKT